MDGNEIKNRTALDACKAMHWDDRVYGPTTIEDVGLLRVIATPTFQRLRGIRQAGPSAFAHPFKTVSRFEHSLGVFTLLRRLGASHVECAAGLLHDISHTAFSHAVDFLFDTEEQAHHELLKPRFLNRPDLADAIRRLGFQPELFYDDTIYTLLERPLPWLCADRIDYFLRDGVSCGVLDDDFVARALGSLCVVDGAICVDSIADAREIQWQFAEMNRRFWSGPIEAFIYNEFADALREGLACGAIRYDDLLVDDAHVLACLRGANNPTIHAKLDRVIKIPPDALANYRPLVEPKKRWLDPLVAIDGHARPLSQFDAGAARSSTAKAG